MRSFVLSFLDRKGRVVSSRLFQSVRVGSVADYARTAIHLGAVKGAVRYRFEEV